VVEPSNDKWCVDLVAIPYDYHAASKRAMNNGRPDWAVALRTGYASE
jgi:hypothetical protein